MAKESFECGQFSDSSGKVTVTVWINKEEKKIKLHGNRLPQSPQRGDTFCVDGGDTLRWLLRGKNGDPDPHLGTSKVRVRFVKFNGLDDPPPLLEEEKNHTLDENAPPGGDRLITGTVVDDDRKGGRYIYELRLVDDGREDPDPLKCEWNTAPSADPKMGGGVRSGGPKGIDPTAVSKRRGSRRGK